MINQIQRWLDEVKKVLLDDSQAPPVKVHEHDEVLGELPDDLKRLFVVYDQVIKTTDRACKKAHKRLYRLGSRPRSHATDADIAFVLDHQLGHLKRDVLKEIFWASVRAAFPDTLIDERTLSVRKNWKVVLVDSKHDCKHHRHKEDGSPEHFDYN